MVNTELSRQLDEFGLLARAFIQRIYDEHGRATRTRLICHMRKRNLARVPWDVCLEYLVEKGYFETAIAGRNSDSSRTASVCLLPGLTKEQKFQAVNQWELDYMSDHNIDLKDKPLIKRDRRTREQMQLAKRLKQMNPPKRGRPVGSRNKSVVMRELLFHAAPLLLDFCLSLDQAEKDALSDKSLLLLNRALEAVPKGVEHARL